MPESHDSDREEEEDEEMDSIRRNQLDLGGATTLTNMHIEASVVTNMSQQGSAEARTPHKESRAQLWWESSPNNL